MKDNFDFLIVGAGITGCVLAERLSSIGKKVLIIDKRKHIGGNCYDFYDSAGVLIHRYGPHYFRAKSEKVISYLSQFTDWIDQKYKVKCRIGAELYSFPINKKTIEQYFKKKFESEKEVEEYLDSIRDKTLVSPMNAEEQVISKIGKRLYESFFKGYTEKQWGVPAKELDSSVTSRIPIRFEDNDDYISEYFQAMPKQGYTKMFERMLKNEKINLKLNTSFSENMKDQAKKIIWSGKIDEYYNYKFGYLPYRSLNFIFASFYKKEFVQEVGQINYPEKEIPYTRIVEIKHVTKQIVPNTTISIEIPGEGLEPYYPMPTKDAKKIYEKYLEDANNEKNVFFIGRLAKYRYLNMDQCVEEALNLFEKLKNEE